MSKSKVLKIVLPVLVLAGLGVGAYFLWFRQPATPTTQTETVKVAKGEIKPTLTITGTVVSENETGVNFETAGELTEVNVKVGDMVAAGQELAKVDDKDLQRQVTIAKANLNSANAKMKQLKAGSNAADIRVQQVSVDNALTSLNQAKNNLESVQNKTSPPATQAELDAAQEKVNQAQGQYNLAVAQLEAKKAGTTDYDIEIQQAAVAQAKENYQQALDNLAQATLKAPIAGTVLAVNASVGEQVAGTGSTGGGSQGTSGTSTSQTGGSSTSSSSNSSSSSDFIVIADLTKLQIKASVDQVDIPKVAKDQKVSITLDAIPDKDFKGKVVTIDPNPASTQNVITYNIVVSIENPDPKIQLGMTADLEIDLGRKENVLVAPNLAVKSKNGSKVVTKIIDGTPTDVPVEVGLSDDKNTEITSGLSEGDKVSVGVFSSTGQGGQSEGTSTQRTPGMGGFFR